MDPSTPPTLYPHHAHLLCIGQEAAKFGGVRRRGDFFGTWELHEAPLEALERAIKLMREDRNRRLILDVADCLCLDDRDWRGEGVRTLSRFSSRQPAGSIVMTRSFQSAIMPHIEDPNDLAPLLASAESPELSVFQPTEQILTHERSNLAVERPVLVGRGEALARLEGLFSGHRGVTLLGGAGVGKSALARAYGAAIALHDPGREVWWTSIRDCDTWSSLVHRLAKLFNLRLSPDEGEWAARINAMLQNRPLAPTLILDDMDALNEEARANLTRDIIAASTQPQWLITSRRGPGLTNLASMELEPLDEVSSLTLLMKGEIASAAVEDLAAARGIWRACSGHPAALAHARHHNRRLGQEGLEVLEETLSEPLRLERDWSLFDEDDRLVLLLLGKMSASTSAPMLETLLQKNVDVHLARLERIGWAQRDPGAPRIRWMVPGLFAKFVEAQTSGERHQEVDEQRADALLRFLDEAFADLRTNKQPEALATLRHHERDILDVLDWGMQHRQRQTLALVARMRLFYTMAHNSFAYLPLLDRARELVDPGADPVTSLELDLSYTIFADYNPNLTMSANELYAPLLARAEEFSPLSRAELFHHRATYLEDLLENAEVIQECAELLHRALSCLEDAHALDQRASVYCALARIELARSELDLALEYAYKGREAAIANGSHLLLGTASFALHRTYMMKGDRGQARHHGQRALEEMEKAGATPSSIMALASLGYMHLLQGNGGLSREHLYRALRLSMANSYEFGVMNCHYLLGLAYLIDVRWEHAREHLQKAEQLQVKYNIEWNINQNKIAMSIIHAGRGELVEASARWEEARAYFVDCPNPEISDFLAMARFAPDVYRAAWEDRSLEHLSEIEDAINAHDFANDMERGAHQGILLALVRAARAELGEAPARALSVLRIARDGSRFYLPESCDEVDLSRRRTVKRVLAILAHAREHSPGEVLDAHTLVERGWPGEIFEVRAGLMRLYVTINTLRKLGLEEILQTHGEGYRLDPQVPFEAFGQADEANASS